LVKNGLFVGFSKPNIKVYIIYIIRPYIVVSVFAEQGKKMCCPLIFNYFIVKKIAVFYK